MEYLCRKSPWICSTCRKHFPVLSSLTGFVTIFTRRVPLVKQELLTLLEHLSSPPTHKTKDRVKQHTHKTKDRVKQHTHKTKDRVKQHTHKTKDRVTQYNT
jgi:hypothetical protein